jgi:ATP-binding cassette subfamily B protein
MSKNPQTKGKTGAPSLGALMKDELLADTLGGREKRDLRPLARILPFVRAHPADAVLGLLFLLISALALLVLTRLAGWVIDGGFTRHNRTAMVRLFFEAGGVVAILAVTTGLRLYFLYKLGERVVADMRKAIFRHVLRLDQSHFLELRNGEVLSRLTTDMTMVEGIVGNVVPVALRNIVILFGALVWMVALSPNLTGIVLLLIPALLTPLFLLSRRMQQLSVRAQDRFAEAVGFAGEHLGALETVQAFGREPNVSGSFDGAVERAFEASRSQLRARGLLSAMMISVIFLGMLALLYQSAVAVIVQHSLTGGALSQLLLLAFFAANAVKDLSELWGQIQKASGAPSHRRVSRARCLARLAARSSSTPCVSPIRAVRVRPPWMASP